MHSWQVHVICTHFQVLGKSPKHYRHHLATCCKFGNRKVVKLKLQKLLADVALLANVVNIGLVWNISQNMLVD